MAGLPRYINLDAKPRDPGMRAAILSGYTVPSFFRGDVLREHCAADLPKRWILFGASGSGSRHHIDPLNTSAWNALLRGSKRWVLYPPGIGIPPGLEREVDTLAEPHDYFAQDHPFARDMGHWGVTAPWQASRTPPLTYFQRVLHREETQTPRALHCMQRVGDVMFVPSGWWHAVLNTEHTVAITENFALGAHAQQVLGELDRRAQVVNEEPTAPGECAGQLRKSQSGVLSSVEPVLYSKALAGQLISAPQPLQLLLFDGCGGLPQTNARDALHRSTAACARAMSPRVLVVRIDCNATDVRGVFGVATPTPPTLRGATLRGTLFKFSPPQEPISLNGLEAWASSILAGNEKPYLTSADRQSLLRMMRGASAEL